MAQKYSEIIKKLGRNRVKVNERLAKHTTFGIGGPADLFYEAQTANDLVKTVKLARHFKVPYFILGGGSNLLVADEGFRGLLINIRSSKLKVNGEKIVVEAGVSLANLVNKAAEGNLAGLEFATGIPGTVGGAVRGNAGAWRQSIGDQVVRVKILDQANNLKWVDKKDCLFGYRQSRFKKNQEIILEVELELSKGNKEEILKRMNQYLGKRRCQPKEPSAGCTFINPETCPAGELIETCGLKGKRIGRAQISPYHANFIVNLGDAKAEDVLKLIHLAKTKVKERFNVSLTEEICLLGFAKMELPGS